MLRFSKWSFIVILQFSYWLWWQYEILNKPSWKIIFSPGFRQTTQDHHNVGYVKNIYLQLLWLAKYHCKGVVKFNLSDLFFWLNWLLSHWLKIMCTLWSVVKCTNVVNPVWRLQNEKNFTFSLIFWSFSLSSKSGLGKSWQIVDFMFTFEENEHGEHGGRGVKTLESWANVLFECPLRLISHWC